MTTVEKLSLSLPREQANFIHSVVESGEYGSASELMRDALRALKYERMARQAALDELRAEVRRGFESGAGEQIGVEEFLSRARARNAERK